MKTTLKSGKPLILRGSPFVRGQLQAVLNPEMVDPVRKTILTQLGQHKELLQSDRTVSYLINQTKITKDLFPEVFEEINGIAEGFGLEVSDLFSFYHLRIIKDMEGCTSWAVFFHTEKAVLGKNRDLAIENKALQRVFLHDDLDWGGRKILSIGSLGAPCAYSSGINSAGFCLADTNILTSDHGPGVCRYILMPYLLASCNNVDQALKKITESPHAGGGALVLADQKTEIAAVELGHHRLHIDRGCQWLAKTNHFSSGKLGPYNLEPDTHPDRKDSIGRLGFVRKRLPAIHQNFSLENALEMMRSHDPEGGICKHRNNSTSATISGAVYDCKRKKLYFSDGSPCNSPWYEFFLDA